VAERGGFEPSVPAMTIVDGLLTAYKVAREFEFNPAPPASHRQWRESSGSARLQQGIAASGSAITNNAMPM